jgi:hypothetical protein
MIRGGRPTPQSGGYSNGPSSAASGPAPPPPTVEANNAAADGTDGSSNNSRGPAPTASKMAGLEKAMDRLGMVSVGFMDNSTNHISLCLLLTFYLYY